MKHILAAAVMAAICQLETSAAYADNLLAIDNPAGHGTTYGVYADGQGFIGNDNVSVAEYLHKWHGDYQSRSGSNIGLLSARSEAGAQYGDLRIGFMGRAEGLVQMDREVADLYHLYQNRLGYQAGQSLGGRYNLKAFSADGLHLSDNLHYAWSNGLRLSLGGGVSYLHGQWMKAQMADGRIVAVGPQDLSGSAQMQNQEGMASGNDGYAADVGAVLSWQDGRQVSLAVNDLAGRMRWRNAFIQDETVTSAPGAGEPHAKTSAPAWQDLVFNLHPKWSASASKPIGQFDLEADISGTQGYWFPQVGAAWHFGKTWQLDAQYDFRFQSIGFKVSNSWLSLGVRSQNWLSPSQSRAYGLSASLFKRF